MHCDDLNNIPPFTRMANYTVDVGWSYIEDFLQHDCAGADLNPDFQRGHVWDDEKRIRYVEYIMREGCGARDIYFNHPTWMNTISSGPKTDFLNQMLLVDGKQRLEAVRKFLASELPAFGTLYKNFKGRLAPNGPRFRVHINNLKTRAEVLQWYLDLNDGGVVHSADELARVRALLAAESKT